MKRFFLLLASALLVAGWVTGCGGSSSGSDTELLVGANRSLGGSANLGNGNGGGSGNGGIGGPTGPVGPGSGSPVIFDPGLTEGALVSISVNPPSLAMQIGEQQQLSVTGTLDDNSTVLIEPSTEVSLSFASSGPEVTVDGDGLVTAIQDGTATIDVEVTIEGQTFVDSVPVSVGASGVLVNGDFGTGDLTGWMMTTVAPGSFSGFPFFGIQTTVQFLPSQNGNPFFALDVPGGADGFLSQTVTLPTGSSVELHYRVWGNLDPVDARVIVGTESDFFTPPPLNATPSTPSGLTDEVRILDLTSLAGQTVTIELGATSNGINGTFANFDDVEIVVVP